MQNRSSLNGKIETATAGERSQEQRNEIGLLIMIGHNIKVEWNVHKKDLKKESSLKKTLLYIASFGKSKERDKREKYLIPIIVI